MANGLACQFKKTIDFTPASNFGDNSGVKGQGPDRDGVGEWHSGICRGNEGAEHGIGPDGLGKS